MLGAAVSAYSRGTVCLCLCLSFIWNLAPSQFSSFFFFYVMLSLWIIFVNNPLILFLFHFVHLVCVLACGIFSVSLSHPFNTFIFRVLIFLNQPLYSRMRGSSPSKGLLGLSITAFGHQSNHSISRSVGAPVLSQYILCHHYYLYLSGFRWSYHPYLI